VRAFIAANQTGVPAAAAQVTGNTATAPAGDAITVFYRLPDGSPRDRLLTPADLEAIPDAIALLPFELGLRFLTDHLAGDVYFRTERPGHNLDRALVQFRLAASVERQRAAIEALVERL
jgi:hypothetical protein